MANRVRFQSLVLAGFGRYDRATRFNLDGRSCTFTSANELGKSTFQAGLLATLFGPPGVRAKAAAFQSRYRSWHGPIAFSGQLDLTVNDEPWRIQQDFESLETKVWRLSNSDSGELRMHIRAKTARSGSEAEPYGQLLEDWLGLSDIALYEAMFAISQESTLSQSWRIDPRIASMVYGESVDRLDRTLHELFGRFRDISRNTREFQISVGSQGERNGRSDGRYDIVVARIAECETTLESTRARLQAIESYRNRLSELLSQCDQLRTDLSAVSRSLESWQAWIELESRLRPAVDSYERFRNLNEKCQQVTRPLNEARVRLVQEFAVFETAPPDVAERLEYYPLLVQAVTDAEARLQSADEQRGRLHEKLNGLVQRHAEEFGELRGRPDLADQVEELRLVLEETDGVQRRLDELMRSVDCDSMEHGAARQRRAELEPWRPFVTIDEAEFVRLRDWVEQFRRDHAEFEAIESTIASAADWIRQQDMSISSTVAERDELTRTRQNEELSLAASVSAMRSAIDRARDARERNARARGDAERRYVDFVGAPPNLPELWDRLCEVTGQASVEQRTMEQLRKFTRGLEQRTLWRRTLTCGGAAVVLACPLIDHHWLGWFAAVIAAALSASLHWLFRVSAADIGESRRLAQKHEAEFLRLVRQRDEITATLGNRFVVPPEREAEWRRLWPAYCREIAQCDVTEQALPGPQQIAEWVRQSTESETRLATHRRDTAALLAESEQSLMRARAERVRRQNELDRLNDQRGSHIERYFGAIDKWLDRPVHELMPPWSSVVQLLGADGTSVESVAQLVDWCRRADDPVWMRFRELCRELRELDAMLAPDPVQAAATEQAICDARAQLDELSRHSDRLAQAVAPFHSGTDPEWLREQRQRSDAMETAIAELELEIESLPSPELVCAELEQAEATLADAREQLAPILERFGQDSYRAASALMERDEVQAQLRELESQASEVLAESGFDSLEALAHEAGKAEGLVGSIRAESQELLSRSEELWNAVDAAPELAQQRADEYETRSTELQRSLDSAERERAELVATIRQLEADPNNDIAVVETELEHLRTERIELEQRRQVIAAEFHEANRLMQELQRVERTALEGRITAYFADFSRTPGRCIELDDDLRIRVRNEDGTRYDPDRLSHGARDQLYLAVYLAATASFNLPFILDDPFVNCDAERLAAIRSCWDRLIPDHQLILLSHNPQMAAWAPSLKMRDAA